MSEASRLAMKRFASGGTGSVRSLPSEIRRNRVSRMRACSNWQWHLDEVFVTINGVTHYLWRAVDHEGELLESYVTKRRDRKSALKSLRKSMKRYGSPEIVVTDKLQSYGAAMKVIGNADRQETGRWQNNRAENSHLPFRRLGTCHAALSADAKSAEIRRSPFFNSQPFQPGAPPQFTRQFQAQPRRRSCGVARPWRGLKDSFTVLVETGSNWSDTTANTY